MLVNYSMWDKGLIPFIWLTTTMTTSLTIPCETKTTTMCFEPFLSTILKYFPFEHKKWYQNLRFNPRPLEFHI